MRDTIPMAPFRTLYRPDSSWPTVDGVRWLLIAADLTGLAFIDEDSGKDLCGGSHTLLEADGWAARHIKHEDMGPYRRACEHHQSAERYLWDDYDVKDKMIAKNWFPTLAVARAAARRMAARSGGLYEEILNPWNTSRWALVRQPLVGEPVSYEINGDAHYAGLIVRVTARKATAEVRCPLSRTAPEQVVFTKKVDGRWSLRGQRCRMIHGVRSKRNPDL